MKRFIVKRKQAEKPLRKQLVCENKMEKNIKEMDTREKIMMANEVLGKNDNIVTKVKKVRSDKGLIEKTESSKIILTEDNRELLND